MRAHLDIAVCCAALACGSCSLVVDELDLHCDKQSDCDALNAAEHLDLKTDCFVYQCRSDTRGCEKREQDLDNDGAPADACDGKAEADIDCDDNPETGAARTPGAEERCDGVDNNCNEVIDEDAGVREGLHRQALDGRPVVGLSHGYSPDRQLLVALATKDRDTRGVGLWGMQGSADAGDIVRVGSISSESTNDKDCSGPMSSFHCVFEQLALAVQGELMLALGVNVAAGQELGQVRLGVDLTLANLESSGAPHGQSPFHFAWNEDALASSASTAAKNLFAGRPCEPGASCEAPANLSGASSPSLTILANRRGPWQALALWRAGPSGATAPLVGIGLWVRGGLIADTTGGGNAEVIDEAAGSGSAPASVHPWVGSDLSGYFIGYDAGKSVALTFVPALAGPSQPPSQNHRRAVIAARGEVRHVALALQSNAGPRPTPRGLAAAWRFGTDERVAIHFAEISFDPSVDHDAFSIGAPVIVTEGQEIVEGPAMVHVLDGFTTLEASPPGRSGGWFVTWVEQHAHERRLLAARVAESTGQRLEEPFLVFQAGHLEHLFTYVDERSVAGYGFVTTEDAGTLNIGALSCRDL